MSSRLVVHAPIHLSHQLLIQNVFNRVGKTSLMNQYVNKKFSNQYKVMMMMLEGNVVWSFNFFFIHSFLFSVLLFARYLSHTSSSFQTNIPFPTQSIPGHHRCRLSYKGGHGGRSNGDHAGVCPSLCSVIIVTLLIICECCLRSFMLFFLSILL